VTRTSEVGVRAGRLARIDSGGWAGGGAKRTRGRDKKGRLAELRTQHDRLGALFAALSELVGSIALDPESRARALHLLDDLESQLPAHFAYEEAGGYLSEELAAAPRLRHRAGRLQREHRELSLRLSHFARHARAGEATDWKGLAEELRDFIDAVRQHELEENRLIRSALMDDLGGGS
jgi:hypothetical protein